MIYIITNKLSKPQSIKKFFSYRLYEKLLSLGIDCNIIKYDDPNLNQILQDYNNVVINWGSTKFNSGDPSCILLNYPKSIKNTSNKLRFFEICNQNNETAKLIPPFTTSKETAIDWVNTGKIVYCRTLIQSSKGKGIVTASSVDELVDAPLYTLGFPTYREYRVHLLPDYTSFIARKKKQTTEHIESQGKQHNPLIRNLSSGYIFSINLDKWDENYKSSILSSAYSILNAVNLDFGAVDIALSKKGEIVVFEINTAPALIGTTLSKYAESIKNIS